MPSRSCRGHCWRAADGPSRRRCGPWDAVTNGTSRLRTASSTATAGRHCPSRRILLHLLVTTFLAADAPLVLLVDGTLERRWGRKIRLKGRSHDAVRSQTGHVATSDGIQWLCPLPASCCWSQSLERAAVGPARAERADALAGAVAANWAASGTAPRPSMPRSSSRWCGAGNPTATSCWSVSRAFATAGLALTCRHLAVRFVSRLLLTAQRYDPVLPQPARQAGRQAEEGTAAAQALGAAH